MVIVETFGEFLIICFQYYMETFGGFLQLVSFRVTWFNFWSSTGSRLWPLYIVNTFVSGSPILVTCMWYYTEFGSVRYYLCPFDTVMSIYDSTMFVIIWSIWSGYCSFLKILGDSSWSQTAGVWYWISMYKKFYVGFLYHGIYHNPRVKNWKACCSVKILCLNGLSCLVIWVCIIISDYPSIWIHQLSSKILWFIEMIYFASSYTAKIHQQLV